MATLEYKVDSLSCAKSHKYVAMYVMFSSKYCTLRRENLLSEKHVEHTFWVKRLKFFYELDYPIKEL